MSFSIVGQDKVLKGLLKLSINNFDSVVRDEALKGVARLVINTPKRTGNLRRGWTQPRRVGIAKYEVANRVRVGTRTKYLLAQLFNDGVVRGRTINAYRFIDNERKEAEKNIKKSIIGKVKRA